MVPVDGASWVMAEHHHIQVTDEDAEAGVRPHTLICRGWTWAMICPQGPEPLPPAPDSPAAFCTAGLPACLLAAIDKHMADSQGKNTLFQSAELLKVCCVYRAAQRLPRPRRPAGRRINIELGLLSAAQGPVQLPLLLGREAELASGSRGPMTTLCCPGLAMGPWPSHRPHPTVRIMNWNKPSRGGHSFSPGQNWCWDRQAWPAPSLQRSAPLCSCPGLGWGLVFHFCDHRGLGLGWTGGSWLCAPCHSARTWTQDHVSWRPAGQGLRGRSFPGWVAWGSDASPGLRQPFCLRRTAYTREQSQQRGKRGSPCPRHGWSC